jgi:hypothetical protein
MYEALVNIAIWVGLYLFGVVTAPLFKKLWNVAFSRGDQEIDKLGK